MLSYLILIFIFKHYINNTCYLETKKRVSFRDSKKIKKFLRYFKIGMFSLEQASYIVKYEKNDRYK